MVIECLAMLSWLAVNMHGHAGFSVLHIIWRFNNGFDCSKES